MTASARYDSYAAVDKRNISYDVDGKVSKAAIGIRLEPMDALSLGIGFWEVKLRNQIQKFSGDDPAAAEPGQLALPRHRPRCHLPRRDADRQADHQAVRDLYAEGGEDRAGPGGGNQVGYDGRYTDPLGRTFYLTGSYKF